MKGGKRDVFVLQFTDGQALTGLGIFPLRMEDPAEDNSSHHAPQTSMQWRKLRAGCLHYSRRIAVSGGFLNATAIHVRNVYTIGPDEEIAPWNTSWSEHDDQREENSTPPYSRDISLAVASNAKERGVLIDERGQLKVTSQARAERDCRTVLVLSAASTSLTEADFTRLLPESERSEGRGIDAVIPGRHPERLNRLPYWILLFKTPFRAASYQSRLRWYHQNAVDNLPMNPLQAAQIPGRGLTPPPGYIDPETGDDVWKRLREYALLQPAQRFSITALLPKFPPTIVRDIQRHERWTMASGIRSWTVRIWLDGDQLTKDRFCRFLQEDGEARNRAWGLASQWSTGVPEDDQSRHTPVQAVTETGTAWRGAETIQNLVVTFSNESEAVKFWRTWHRRPFPTTADGAGPGHGAPLLNVELMW